MAKLEDAVYKRMKNMLADVNMDPKEVSAATGVSMNTVYKWKNIWYPKRKKK